MEEDKREILEGIVMSLLDAFSEGDEEYIVNLLHRVHESVPETSKLFDELDWLLHEVKRDVLLDRLYHQIDKLVELKDISYSGTFRFYLVILQNLKEKFKPDVNKVVYFIENSLGRVKIGYSSNFTERFRSLKYSSGDDLNIIFKYQPVNVSMSELESRLHIHYSQYNVFGEWFNIPDSEQDFLFRCSNLDC